MTPDERPGPDTPRPWPDTPGTTRPLPVIERAGEAAAGEPVPEAPPAVDERARRFRSPRRVPAALTALAVLAVAAPLLYDIAAVRAGRTAMAWRRRLAAELAVRPLDDPWIIGGATAACVLGLWLIVLAVTPGLRAVLPMRRDTPAVRAGLDRHAAELVLRDRAMEVSGVHAVRATVTRRKAVVRAEVHFGDPGQVRTDLGTALADGIAELGLVRPPALTLRIRHHESVDERVRDA